MNDEDYMREALKSAQKAIGIGEVPVGAVVVLDGKIIGRGYNQRETKNDVSSHAEIEALKEAGAALGSWKLSDATLYVTLEPCLMCAAAIVQARVHRVVYGADDPQEGAITAHHFIYDDPSIKERPLVSRGVLQDECSILLQSFFFNRRKKKVPICTRGKNLDGS
jgi:tRNA(adenine34) deaminase